MICNPLTLAKFDELINLCRPTPGPGCSTSPVPDFCTHAGNVSIDVEEGLTPLHTMVSSEVDRYASGKARPHGAGVFFGFYWDRTTPAR